MRMRGGDPWSPARTGRSAATQGGLGFHLLLEQALLELARLPATDLAGLVVVEVLLDVLGQTFLLAALLEAAEGLFEGLTGAGFDTDHGTRTPEVGVGTVSAAVVWQGPNHRCIGHR